MDIFQRLHGTTTDQFKIGSKSQRIVLTGVNQANDTVALTDRFGNQYTADSTIFFTAYLIGQDTDTVSLELKGSYIQGTTGASGTVVTAFVNTNNIPLPTVNFNSSGTLSIDCTGILGQNLKWTCVVDIVKI